MTAQKPEAIKLALEYRETMPADVLHMWAGEVVGELRRLHAANADCIAWYESAKQDIASLLALVKELEAQLEAIGAGGVEPLRRDHFRGVTKMVHVGWAISYDGKNPHALWTAGDGDLLDLEVKRQGGTACKMQLYARVEK